MTMNTKIPDERGGLPSASSMERIALCPGSWRLESGIAEPEEESSWAAEGTLIHAVLAGEADETVLDSDQQWVVDRCREIRENLMTAIGVDATYEEREQRQWFRSGDNVYSGKPDVLIRDGRGTAIILDWKTGRGAVTPAESNYQMRALAVLAQANDPSLTCVYVALIHPRVQSAETGAPFTIARYDNDDLVAATGEITMILSMARNEAAPRIAGERQCKYCRAKAQCPEALGVVVALVPPDVTGKSQIVVPELAAAEIASLLEKGELVDEVLKQVRAQAKRRLEAGEEIPGWTLKAGNNLRSIEDPQKAYDAIADDLSPEQFLKSCSVSVGKLASVVKEVLGLKGKKADDYVNEKLGDAITVKQNAPSLARATAQIAESTPFAEVAS